MVILTSCKRTKAAKRILRTNVNNGKCDNMGNTNRTVILIPKPKAGQYLFLFHVRYYLEVSLIYNKFLK